MTIKFGGPCAALFLFEAVISLAALFMASTTAAESSVSPSRTLSWTVYHSWNAEQAFARRGVLKWTAPTPEAGDSSTTSSSSSSREDPTVSAGFVIVNDAEPKITANDVKEMLDYGWYHIKIQSDNGSETMATVPACNLRRASFKDQFDITLPRSSGPQGGEDHLLSFAYTALVSPLAPKSCEGYLEAAATATSSDGGEDDNDGQAFSFSSKLSIQLDTPAMNIRSILPPQSKPPPGLAFTSKMKASQSQRTRKGDSSGGSVDGEDDEVGGDQEEQPTGPFAFLQRYWYILLPMLIMNMMTTSPSPSDEQGQGSGDAAAPAAPQVAAAPAGGQTGGAAAGKKSGRRGKRT